MLEGPGLERQGREGRVYLVTGGLGYLGSRLVEHLLREGNRTRITTRRPVETCPDWTENWDICQVNTFDKRAWMKALKDVDFVFHMAAPDAELSGYDPKSALRAGGEMTWSLIDAISDSAKRAPVINVSTFHIYGPYTDGLITESTPPRPVHPYAVGHLFSEIVLQSLCRQKGIHALNVRLSNAFGRPIAFDTAKWSLVFNDLCMQAVTSNRLCLKSAGHQKRNFITLEDAVRGLSFLSERHEDWPEDHTIQLGSSLYLSIREVAERIAGRYEMLWGKRPEITFPENGISRDKKDFVFDVSRMQKAGFVWLNSIDKEIDDTLKLCMNWSGRK
jgi:UDP-glucose 4-epimerase